jgi:ATP-independent RNA helicase DbpA
MSHWRPTVGFSLKSGLKSPQKLPTGWPRSHRDNALNQTSFATLGLSPELLETLASLGYESMTPIQEQSLPPILAGQDVIAQGKTGSGKTAAFGLGLLAKLDIASLRVQSLVLCPTRELADQVAKEIRKLARAVANVKVLTLSGGQPYRAQADSLEFGAHIVVGTPGRLEDHLRKKSLDLGGVTTVVLDEADRMLEMGFQESVEAIVAQTPKSRQTLLFSATYPAEIQAIAKRIMRQPVTAFAESTHDSSTIQQHFYTVTDDQQRLTAVRLLLLRHRPESTVVFCNTKREAQEIAEDLRAHGFSCLALHGDLDQRDRDQTLVRFSNKSVSVLVATDVAARGLDIDSLDAVINYHIAHDTEMHVHRIGRTGRAGSKGKAHSLISEKEGYKVALLQDYLGQPITPEPLPPTSLLNGTPNQPEMETLLIDGGKKQKVRAGDILGALTGEGGIAGSEVGKIDLFDIRAYVAVQRKVVKQALKKLSEGKLKGRSFRVRLLRGQPESARN